MRGKISHIGSSLLPVLGLLFVLPLAAQLAPHRPGQLLVSLQAGARADALTQPGRVPVDFPLSAPEKVAGFLNCWMIQTASDPLLEQAALHWLHAQPEVRMVQFNWEMSSRYAVAPPDILPDDPLFSSQWQFLNTGANGLLANADLDAEQAWEITTGGLSPAGDTIVVAVVDRGVDDLHPDLAPNLWKNFQEIPADGLDNDANGYVDDFRGWNVYVGNDDIGGQISTHGTPVSAVVGARGHNTQGVTGVNWQVKIMFVAGGGFMSDILAAYDYIWNARRLYNDSQGQQGAFVVATNCSYGIDHGQPADAPLWCAAFDSLGAAGILNVASTANLGVNVDVVGDLPTTCPSDYMVAVTTLDGSDVKPANAAWGPQHIDLGAYGTGIYTAAASQGYGTFSGTSFAAPHVAGAIGLLYSAPCPALVAQSQTDPAGAVQQVKALLLNSVSPNTSLADITVSGGRLNLYSLLQQYQDQCPACPAPFSLQAEPLTESAQLNWMVADSTLPTHLRWRPLGSSTWNILSFVHPPLELAGLLTCQPYEFSVQTLCTSGLPSDWSPPFLFQTAGCCLPPVISQISGLSVSSATLHWEEIGAANIYNLRVRPEAGAWDYYQTDHTWFNLSDLTACTSFEAQVQSLCGGTATGFSASVFFTTTDCGPCLDAPYCTASGGAYGGEWIEVVHIGSWSYFSGAGGGGYQDFTDLLAPGLQLYSGDFTWVELVPGFSGAPFLEYFRIYVDFNGDGDFDDPDELAFDPGFVLAGPVSGTMYIPPDLSPGPVRMRIMMKFLGTAGAPPMPCEMFLYGQVEDFCAELLPVVTATEAAQQELPWQLTPNPAGSQPVRISWPAEGEGPNQIRVWDLAGRLIMSLIPPATGSEFYEIDVFILPPGIYNVEMLGKEKTVFRKLIRI